MNIEVFQGGYDKNLCYVIWCDKTKHAALIDASVNITPIVEFIEHHELILTKLFITHTHFDHIAYIKDITLLFPLIKIYCYKKAINISKNYTEVIHNQMVTVGNLSLIILYTPGHFIDSISIWSKEYKTLFTGDTMFVGRTGRTINKLSNIEDLYNSIYNILLKLPKETIVYPGHHYGFKKSITLKNNVDLSPFFQCNSLKNFIDVMKNYEKNR